MLEQGAFVLAHQPRCLKRLLRWHAIKSIDINKMDYEMGSTLDLRTFFLSLSTFICNYKFEYTHIQTAFLKTHCISDES